MLEAKQLIQMNNKNRTGLTPENEKYYDDFLIYIRLQLTVSAQQSEEVLMEILDHLLEGQQEGKSAKMIFGEDPKAFADEIIENLPGEKKRDAIMFVSSLALNLLGIFLIMRGMMLGLISLFKDVSDVVYPVTSGIIALSILCSSLLGVVVIFRIISKSLFQENDTKKKDSLKAGMFGVLAMGFILSLTYLLPDIGPSFEFTWYASCIAGAVLAGVPWLLKRY
jgi:uncharacterized membrane-anchored protein